MSIEQIMCKVLHEAYKRQLEETMGNLAERPEGFYKSCLDRG